MANTFSSRNTLKTKLLAAINAANTADKIVKLSRSIEKANLDDDADLEIALDTKVSSLAAASDPEDLEKLAFGVKKLRTPEGAGVPTSTMVAEGSTNLYVTQDRVRGSFSASGDLSYDSGTGVLSYTALPDALTVYATVADLPASGVAAGAKGIVEENKKLYVFTGASWVGVGLVDQKPSFNTNPDGSYSLTPGGDTVITLSATDPQGDPITYSHQVTAGSLGGSSVSQADNVFTITGSTNPADTASFSITFSASDGTNVSTTTPSEFTVQFGTDWSSLAKDTSYTFPAPSGKTQFYGIRIASNGSITGIGDLRWAESPNTAPNNGYVSRVTLYDVTGASPSFVDNIAGYANGDTLDWSGGSVPQNQLSSYGMHEMEFWRRFNITENYIYAGSSKLKNSSNNKYGGVVFHNLSDRTQSHFIPAVLGGSDHNAMPYFGSNGIDFVENHPIQGDVLVASYVGGYGGQIDYTDPSNPQSTITYGFNNIWTGNRGAVDVIKLSDPSNRVHIYNNVIAGNGNPYFGGSRDTIKISPTTNHVAVGAYEAIGGADVVAHTHSVGNAYHVSHGYAAFHENNYNNPNAGEIIDREGRIGVYDMTTGAFQYQVGPTSTHYPPLSGRSTGSNGKITYGAEFGKQVWADSEGFMTFGSYATGSAGAGGFTWTVVWQKFAWADGSLLWTTTVDTGAWSGYQGRSIQEIQSDYHNGYIAFYTISEPGESQFTSTQSTRTSKIRVMETSTGTIVKEISVVGDHPNGIWTLCLTDDSIITQGYGISTITYKI